MNQALLVAAFVACTGTAGIDWMSDALRAVGTESRTMTQTGNTTTTRTSDTEITVRRRFAAPPARVFAALTEPDSLRKWMSAGGRELVESKVDLRPGGSYRHVFRSSKGATFGMYGTYREVVPGRRIVHTEAYDGYDWEPLVTTTVLQEDGNGTTLVMTILYPNKKICDTDFPNVESAAAEGFNRLDKLLAEEVPGDMGRALEGPPLESAAGRSRLRSKRDRIQAHAVLRICTTPCRLGTNGRQPSPPCRNEQDGVRLASPRLRSFDREAAAFHQLDQLPIRVRPM
jgi:uncharacterized protein YndB with AHSA1/START domain